MSKGLGKIERWILVHGYLKTVTHQLPDDWQRIPKDNEKFLYKREVMLNYFHLEHSETKYLQRYEYRSSDYLKYHGHEYIFIEHEKWEFVGAAHCVRRLVSDGKIKYPDGLKFDKKGKAAHVNYSRVTKSLHAKGYINLWTQWRGDKKPHKIKDIEWWRGDLITLTKKGKDKAKDIQDSKVREYMKLKAKVERLENEN